MQQVPMQRSVAATHGETNAVSYRLLQIMLPHNLPLHGSSKLVALLKSIIAMLWHKIVVYRAACANAMSIERIRCARQQQLKQNAAAIKCARNTREIHERLVALRTNFFRQRKKALNYAKTMAYLEDPIIFQMLLLHYLVLKLLELDKNNAVFKQANIDLSHFDINGQPYLKSPLASQENFLPLLQKHQELTARNRRAILELPEQLSYTDLEKIAATKEDSAAQAMLIKEASARLTAIQTKVAAEIVTQISSNPAKQQQLQMVQAQMNLVLLIPDPVQCFAAPQTLQNVFLGGAQDNNMQILARAAAFSAITTNELLAMVKKLHTTFDTMQVAHSDLVNSRNWFYESATEATMYQQAEAWLAEQTSVLLLEYVAVLCQLYFRAQAWNARRIFDNDATVPRFFPLPASFGLDEKLLLAADQDVITDMQDIFHETMTNSLLTQVGGALDRGFAAVEPALGQLEKQAGTVKSARMLREHLLQLQQSNNQLSYVIPIKWRALFAANRSDSEFMGLAEDAALWKLLARMEDIISLNPLSPNAAGNVWWSIEQLMQERNAIVKKLGAVKNPKLKEVIGSIQERLSFDPQILCCTRSNSPYQGRPTYGELLREKINNLSINSIENVKTGFVEYLQTATTELQLRELDRNIAIMGIKDQMHTVIGLLDAANKVGMSADYIVDGLQKVLGKALVMWMQGETVTAEQIMEVLAVDLAKIFGTEPQLPKISEFFRQIKLFYAGAADFNYERLVSLGICNSEQLQVILAKIAWAKLNSALSFGALPEDINIAATTFETYAVVVQNSKNKELERLFKIYTANELVKKFDLDKHLTISEPETDYEANANLFVAEVALALQARAETVSRELKMAPISAVSSTKLLALLAGINQLNKGAPGIVGFNYPVDNIEVILKKH